MVKKVKKLKRSKYVKRVKLVPKIMEAEEPRVEMIAATNESLLGNYSNMALIHHTRLEFVLDFVWSCKNHQILASRVITSPEHAKRIYRALRKNIFKYEEQHGKIIIKNEEAS